MTYEREKNSGGWVSETEKQTVFCSISSTPGAASSSSFSSTSSKHWSLNLLLHPHTASFFVDLQSCTLYGILHEWYKRILIIATLRIYCLQRENVLQSCFFVMVCRVSLSFFYLWLKVLSVFLSLSPLNDIPLSVPSHMLKTPVARKLHGDWIFTVCISRGNKMITLLLARLLSIPCQMPAIDTAGIVLIFVEVTFFCN